MSWEFVRSQIIIIMKFWRCIECWHKEGWLAVLAHAWNFLSLSLSLSLSLPLSLFMRLHYLQRKKKKNFFWLFRPCSFLGGLFWHWRPNVIFVENVGFRWEQSHIEPSHLLSNYLSFCFRFCTDTPTVMDMPKFSRGHIHDVFLIFLEKVFDISCKLSPNLQEMPKLFFLEKKNKKEKKIKMSSAENFTLISVLTHSTLNKNYSRRHFKIIFIFLPENRFWGFSQIVSSRQFAWNVNTCFVEKKIRKKT